MEEVHCDYNTDVNRVIKDYLSAGWELLKMTAHAYKSVLTFKKKLYDRRCYFSSGFHCIDILVRFFYWDTVHARNTK